MYNLWKVLFDRNRIIIHRKGGNEDESKKVINCNSNRIINFYVLVQAQVLRKMMCWLILMLHKAIKQQNQVR